MVDLIDVELPLLIRDFAPYCVFFRRAPFSSNSILLRRSLDCFLIQCYNLLGHGLCLLSNVCRATSFYQMTLTLSLVFWGTVFNPPFPEFAQLIVPYPVRISTVGYAESPRATACRHRDVPQLATGFHRNSKGQRILRCPKDNRSVKCNSCLIKAYHS